MDENDCGYCQLCNDQKYYCYDVRCTYLHSPMSFERSNPSEFCGASETLICSPGYVFKHTDGKVRLSFSKCDIYLRFVEKNQGKNMYVH